MFTRRLTVIVYFAVVLIPVLLLGHDGPWLSGGDAEIRVKTPFPKKFNPGTFRDFVDRVGVAEMQRLAEAAAGGQIILTPPGPDFRVGAGPYTEEGMAATMMTSKYYEAPSALDRSGDFTIQFWMKFNGVVDDATGSWPFSDLDFDTGAVGGIGVVLYTDNTSHLAIDIQTCKNATDTTLEVDELIAQYPSDMAWHLVRIVHSGASDVGTAPGDHEALGFQPRDGIGGQHDEIAALARANALRGIDPAHGQDRDPLAGLLRVVARQVREDVLRRHRRKAGQRHAHLCLPEGVSQAMFAASLPATE